MFFIIILEGGEYMENEEQGAFQLILHSGNARSLAYEALRTLKEGAKAEALSLYEEAKKELAETQKRHSEFLHKAANEEINNISLLLVHAEDHVSSSQVVVELVKEIMELHLKGGEKDE